MTCDVGSNLGCGKSAKFSSIYHDGFLGIINTTCYFTNKLAMESCNDIRARICDLYTIFLGVVFNRTENRADATIDYLNAVDIS